MFKAAIILAGIGALAGPARAEPPVQASPAAEPDWAAAALGRVRPYGGEAHAGTAVPALIADVAVQAGDRVKAGDLLVRLADDETAARAGSAKVEATLRLKDRDATDASGLALDRRRAADALYAADGALFEARLKLDGLLAASHEGQASQAEVQKARTTLAEARTRAADEKNSAAQLDKNEKMPLLTRAEAALASARTEISVLHAVLEKTRLRSPLDGAVLRVDAKAGEVAIPGAATGLVTVGNVDRLQVEAELDERDAGKVQIGQSATVKTEAFPGRSFAARVSEIAISLDAPKLTSRNARRPTDIDVLAVVLDLDAALPLLPGMRVDVFFASQDAAPQSSALAPH